MSSESMRLKGNPKSGRPLFNRTLNQILKNPLNTKKFVIDEDKKIHYR